MFCKKVITKDFLKLFKIYGHRKTAQRFLFCFKIFETVKVVLEKI